jgi:phosphatidylinositol glycan class O
MRRKVAEMDRVLSDTIAWAGEQARAGRGHTLVLFFGDHGQTVSGDHGGATPEEVESLLFAYSTLPLISPQQHCLQSLQSLRAAGGVGGGGVARSQEEGDDGMDTGEEAEAATADFFARAYFASSPPRAWQERLPGTFVLVKLVLLY